MTKNEVLLRAERGWRAFGGIVAASGALAVAGCAGNGEAQFGSQTNDKKTGDSSDPPTLTFDYLGGGSKFIRVYPGVGNSPEDTRHNGTYSDGETVLAECKTEGRTVSSNPEVGEEERSSDEWIRIKGTPGETQFATAVYIENPEKLLSELEPCE